MKTLAAAFALLSLPAYGQTWFKVAVESPATTVTLPSGTSYRFGATQTTSGSCGTLGWLPGVSTGAPLVVYYTSFTCDPAPNVVKEFDVMETATAQTVKVGTATITVPALITPAPLVVAKPTVVSTFTCTVNLYSDGSYASTTCVKAGK